MIFGDDIQHQYYFFREFSTSFAQRYRCLVESVFVFRTAIYCRSDGEYLVSGHLAFLLPAAQCRIFLAHCHPYFWACMGMYVLVHTITGTKGTRLDPAAWASGVIFGLSGFLWRTWAGHVDVIAAAAWMPWVVYAFLRVMKVRIGHISSEEKIVAIASITFALQLLSGYQTMAFLP